MSVRVRSRRARVTRRSAWIWAGRGAGPAACAVWPSGRVESWALAPGVPSLSEAEREDQVPEGAYRELVRSGGLSVDDARAVPDIGLLLSRIWDWEPTVLVSDPYRAAELHQVVAGRVRIVERGARRRGIDIERPGVTGAVARHGGRRD